MINNKLFRGFTFDGVNSLDYDIYITGAGVYNAPERAVEKVSVPGRNGDLTIDQGRFENIEVTYAECGCAATMQEEFAEKVAAFRNALCSRVGYKRLTDDYNKDEYRMAMYVSGLEVEAIAQHRMGTFDIVFDAKPQRFLYTGETPRLLVQGMTPKNPQTESGAIVSVESDGADKVTSLAAQIEPMQSGSGDPSPTNVRPITGHTSTNVTVAGKNLLYHIYPSQTINGVEFVLRDDGTVVANGTATANAEFSLTYRISGTYGTTRLPHGEYIITGCPSGGGSSTYEIGINTTKNGSGVTMARDYGNGATFTMDSNALIGSWITIRRGVTVNNLIFKPMVRLASETDDTYEPYKGTTYPVSFGSAGTVYGGTVDVVTGVLTVTHKVVTYTSGDGWEWDASKGIARRWVSGMHNAGNTIDQYKLLVECDRLKSGSWAGGTSFTNYDYSCSAYFGDSIAIHIKGLTTLDEYKSWVTNNKPTFRYPLATPQTYNLTAQQVELLTGQNTVWADTGAISLTYGADPYKVVNPTLFESKPLLQVTGRGTLSVGDVTMTITGTASQVLYIDCDIMEVYSITDGQMQPQNSLVTMNSYDFPKLKPGANKITLGVGITQVVVTPRWWRV